MTTTIVKVNNNRSEHYYVTYSLEELSHLCLRILRDFEASEVFPTHESIEKEKSRFISSSIDLVDTDEQKVTPDQIREHANYLYQPQVDFRQLLDNLFALPESHAVGLHSQHGDLIPQLLLKAYSDESYSVEFIAPHDVEEKFAYRQ